MFNEYPYTNFHELNLDWFLDKYKGIFNDIEMLKTIYNKISDMKASKHYYTIREWLHITNETEWKAYLDLFNAGFTSLNCYIDKAGTYKFFDNGSGFPVFNGVQMHIYATVPDVTIDMNGMTFYNGHFVIYGRNGNVKIVDTNTVDRQEYIEGGQAFFTNCDWYCTSRSWYSNVSYSNCKWYDVSPWAGTCVDILGSDVIMKDYCGFMLDSSESYPNYSIFGIGQGGSLQTDGRLLIRKPNGGTHTFITKRQDGVSGVIRLYSSCYDPDAERSYIASDRGTFTEFTNLPVSNFEFSVADERFRYLTPNDEEILNTAIVYHKNIKLGGSDIEAIEELPYASLSMFTSIGVVGDSFANGYTVHGSTRTNNPYVSWLKNIERRNGIHCDVYAQSGLTTRTWLTHENGLAKMNNTDANQLYFLALGINDSVYIDDLGNPADIATHADTFYGNYATIIEDIVAHSPNCKMIMLTCMRYNANTEIINEAINVIAEHYGIPVINVKDDEYMSSTFYLSDQLGSHPTVGGYASISKAIDRLFSMCYVNYKDYFDNLA